MDIVATTDVIPDPGQTVPGTDLHYYPGGKGANQAIAARRAGAPTRMIGRVGADAFGPGLRDYLAAEGIDVDNVGTVDASSGVALIVVQASGENSIVVVPGANGAVDPPCVTDEALEDVTVVVSQLEIPVTTIEALFERCRDRATTTILNTAPALRETGRTFELADVLVLNEAELAAYAGESPRQEAVSEVFRRARRIRRFQRQVIVVTLGSRGAVALHGEGELIVEGVPVPTVDTTGAGDCFVGYLAAGIASGSALARALGEANRAACLSVQTRGAGPSMPYRADVEVGITG